MKLRIDGMDLSISRTDHLQVGLVSPQETAAIKLEGINSPVELKCVNGAWTIFVPEGVNVVQDNVVAPNYA